MIRDEKIYKIGVAQNRAGRFYATGLSEKGNGTIATSKRLQIIKSLVLTVNRKDMILGAEHQARGRESGSVEA